MINKQVNVNKKIIYSTISKYNSICRLCCVAKYLIRHLISLSYKNYKEYSTIIISIRVALDVS